MLFLRPLLLLVFIALAYSSYGQNEYSLDSIWQEITLDDVVVTAQYAPTAIENAVHQVKVIKATEMKQEGQNNLAEVLTNQLNLRVSNDPVLGNGLRIQGIGGENIQVMIDGVAVIGRLNGNVDLSQINLQNIQQIEIIEGAMSAQYGSNASGGVINIITRKSQLKPFKLEAQTQYESIGILNSSLGGGVQLNKWYASITAIRNENSFVGVDELRLYEEVQSASGELIRTKVNPWNPKTQSGLDATLAYRFSDSTKLTYQYRYFDEELENYGEVKRPIFRPYAFDEFYTTDREDHRLNLESYIGRHLYLNTTTAYNQFERLKETRRLDMETDTTSLVIGAQDTSRFTAFLHRTVLSTVSGNAWNGQIGVEVLAETGSGERIVDSTSLPVNQSELANYALWGSLKYQFGPLSIQSNLRYGYNTKYDHPLLPSFHASWSPAKRWDVQLSYAHGFRAPSLKELYFNFIDINHYIVGNEALKPERSQNASLAVTYKLRLDAEQRITLRGKLFYNDIKDRIVLAEFSPLQFNYQNLDQFETHGFNFNAEYQLNNQITLQSGLAYTRLSNRWSESFDTDEFTGLYEMQNRLSAHIPEIAMQIVLTHRFIGRQVFFSQDSNNNLEQGLIGGYHLVNLTLSRSFWNKRIFIAAGIKNFFNTQTARISGSGGDGSAHSIAGDSQLLNWGRTSFARINLTF